MKKTMMFLGVLSLGLAHAQQEFEGKVGVNTDQPNATFNVKSKTGTDEKTKNFELQNAEDKKLVTVLDNGKVGIGTDPTANLDLLTDDNKGVTRLAEFRNVNTASTNRLTINTGTSTSSDRNTLGFALMGKGYVDNKDASLSGNNAVIYSTATNGLNLQVHKKDAKFKFYTGGVGEGAVTMSILPYLVRINADDTTPSNSVLTIGAHTSKNDSSNKLGLMSSNNLGTNLITYYNANGTWDAQLGIGDNNNDQFQVKIFNPNKYFGVYINNSTRFTINNSGFTRIGRQAGATPSMLTVDGTLAEDGEQIGLRLQASQNTSTYTTIYFDKAETGGMRFKTTHNKHNYQFDTSKVVSALKIQTEGNVGIGTPEPKQKLDVAGSIKIASTDDTCDSTKAGTIRFKDNKFQGCTGTEWKNLHN